MPKFFVDHSCITSDHIVLVEDNFNHIKNVLRLNINDQIIINDRQGHDYKCIISEVNQSQIYAKIVEVIDCAAEPATQITLFQSLIKGEKMEWVIQKSVEIGVTEIVPMLASRCVVKLESPKKVLAKVDRWNKIAESAAKQSGRGTIPIVREPLTIEEAIDYVSVHQISAFIPYEKEKATSIKSVLQKELGKKIALFIGPEGGFSEEEIQHAMTCQIQPITLGRRILRSETASLVGLTVIMYEMGEME